MNQHITIAAVMIAGFALAAYPSFKTQEPQTERVAKDLCAQTIRDTLHNPRSVEWVNRNDWPTTRRTNGLTVSMTYRATNGFGATVMQTTDCYVGLDNGRYIVQDIR